MTKAEIQRSLRKCPLFSDFNDDELRVFIDLADPVEVRPGAHIVRQDDLGDSMFLLVEGKARVVHHHSLGRDVELALLEHGDFFGELALVDHGPRSADVIAEVDCVLLAISQATISALAGVYPTAAFKFLITLGRKLVQRMRKSNQRYIDSMLFPIVEKPAGPE